MLRNLLFPLRPDFEDEQIALYLSREIVEDPSLGIRDGYTFIIHQKNPHRKVGYVSLRVGESPALYYLGHIGYRIEEPYRGHSYAAKACELIRPLIRQIGLRSVCITANPDNLPSRKTCLRIGCVLESVVPVPPAFRFVCAGAQEKCRYILIP